VPVKIKTETETTLTVLGETSDTLVELVKGHGVVEQLPSEGSLVVDEGDLLNLVLRGGRSLELLGDGLARKGESVNANQCNMG
jgi:hypothetical protein